MYRLILAGLVMLNWTQSVAQSSKDIFCAPIDETRIIYQLAAQKFYGDSLIATLEGKVIIMENDHAQITKDYTALIENTSLRMYQNGQREAGLHKIIDNYQTEIKSVRKKSRWRSIKFWAAVAVGGTLIALK